MSIAAASRNRAADTIVKTVAKRTLSRPAGIARVAVRGFAASNCRSAMRLNAIAALRKASQASDPDLRRRSLAVLAREKDAPTQKRLIAGLEKKRVMSRKEARERIRPAALEHAMRRVVFDAGRAASLVEEAPAAYRDIAEVLEDEEELVTPLLRLTPIAVLKG